MAAAQFQEIAALIRDIAGERFPDLTIQALVIARSDRAAIHCLPTTWIATPSARDDGDEGLGSAPAPDDHPWSICGYRSAPRPSGVRSSTFHSGHIGSIWRGCWPSSGAMKNSSDP